MYLMFYGKNGLPTALLLFMLLSPTHNATMLSSDIPGYCNKQTNSKHEVNKL